MQAEIFNEGAKGTDGPHSEIVVKPATNSEAAELRWMEEVFDMEKVEIVVRYLGEELTYAIIPAKRTKRK